MYSDNVVIGYCRVSTQVQVDRGQGLEIQKQKIQEYCKKENLNLIKIYEDAGISGAVKDRPALLNLLKDCESGRIKKIIIYKQDRLSRELGVSLWLEAQFKKYDVELVSVLEPAFDTNDPMGKAFKRIIHVFAELERDIIFTRMRDGRENRAKKGHRACGPIPFGYLKKGRQLVLCEDESFWVEKIFKWKVKGYTYSKIVNRLNAKGILTKRKKEFNVEAIRYITKNALYYGENNFGKVKTAGKHEAIISKRLFNKTQNFLQKKA